MNVSSYKGKKKHIVLIIMLKMGIELASGIAKTLIFMNSNRKLFYEHQYSRFDL
jgi:hypothetical protein